jgi:Protein of unknown function (DUF998)
MRSRKTTFITDSNLHGFVKSPHAQCLALRSSAFLLGFFALTVGIEHALQPELSPIDHRVSEYANTQHGWLLSAGFVAWSLSLLAASGAARAFRDGSRVLTVTLRAGLATAALGALTAAIFKTGTSAGVVPRGHRLTLENHIHDAGSGLLELALWIAVLSSLGSGHRALRVASRLVLTGGLLSALLANGVFDAPGAAQRTLLALACVWQFTLLLCIHRPQKEDRLAWAR